MSEYDKWIAALSKETEDSEILICSEHLRRYAKKEAVGSWSHFANATMYFCTDATVRVATETAGDTSIDLERRCRAMALIVFLSLSSRSIRYDPDLLEDLIRSRETEPFSWLEQLGLFQAASLIPNQWKRSRTHIFDSLANMRRELGLHSIALSKFNKRLFMAAVEETRSTFLDKYCTPP